MDSHPGRLCFQLETISCNLLDHGSLLCFCVGWFWRSMNISVTTNYNISEAKLQRPFTEVGLRQLSLPSLPPRHHHHHYHVPESSHAARWRVISRLTSFSLRRYRAEQGREADSPSEEDKMKRRRESGGVHTTSLPPSMCLPAWDLSPLLPPADAFGLLPGSPDEKPFLVLTFRMSE